MRKIEADPNINFTIKDAVITQMKGSATYKKYFNDKQNRKKFLKSIVPIDKLHEELYMLNIKTEKTVDDMKEKIMRFQTQMNTLTDESNQNHIEYYKNFLQSTFDARSLYESIDASKLFLIGDEQISAFVDISNRAFQKKNIISDCIKHLPFPIMAFNFNKGILCEVEGENKYPKLLKLIVLNRFKNILNLYFVFKDNDKTKGDWGNWRLKINFDEWKNGNTVYFDNDYHKKKPSNVVEIFDILSNIIRMCILFIEAENTVLFPVNLNTKKRKSKGKILKPYYKVNLDKPNYHHTSDSKSNCGSSHSYRYDVRGHFRTLSNGKKIWVHSHQRGLKNEIYIPHHYKKGK